MIGPSRGAKLFWQAAADTLTAAGHLSLDLPSVVDLPAQYSSTRERRSPSTARTPTPQRPTNQPGWLLAATMNQ